MPIVLCPCEVLPVGEMAAKRVATSVINWSALSERVPVKQREAFRVFKSRSDAYISRIQQLPEELPKLDFAYYRSHLSTPALVDEFEKMYKSVTVPYPKDAEKAMEQVDEEEKFALEAKNIYVATQKAKIKDSQNVLNRMDSIPGPDEMTMQMFNYYFPEKGLDPYRKPTFWPHTEETQPDTTTIPWMNTREDYYHLMTHDEWEEMWYKKVEEQNKAKLAEAKRREEAAQLEAKK